MQMEAAPAERSGNPAPRLRYMQGLDGLRGLAVAAVLLFHADRLRGGYLGVDLFFVLSGFLITSLLVREGDSGRVDLVRFWGRRARRLLPALGVMLLGVAAYARFAAAPEELHRIRWDGIATMAYVMNWREVFTRTSYWDLFSAPSPFDHTWSLAIEEQFYLIWPLVFLGMLAWLRRGHRRGDRRQPLARVVAITSAVMAVTSLVWAAVCQRLWGWNRVYMGTDTRAFALLLGATLAGVVAWRGQVRSGWQRRWLEVAGWVGAGVLAVAWVTMTGGSQVASHGGLALCSVAGVLVVAAVAHPERRRLSRLVGCTPLRALGLISYGVYLYHWPIFVWLDPDRVGWSGWPLLALQVSVTLAVSTASYFLIERPIRHRTDWSRRSWPITALGSFTVVIVVLAASTLGYEPLAPGTATAQGVPPGSATGPRIMVTGNSVAWFLSRDGFTDLRSDPQFAVYNKAPFGCGYPGTDSGLNAQGRKATKFLQSCNIDWEKSARSFRPDYVLYTRDAFTVAKLHHDGHYVGICSDEFAQWYGDVLRADVRAYLRVGAKVGLITSLPNGRNGWGQFASDTESDTVGCANAVLRTVAAEFPAKVKLIDLDAHLCDGPSGCREKLDGVTLRADGVHFKGRSAQIVAKWILRQIGISAGPD